eukprot:scaffold109557_cov45-Tisochrysis_lutea.AAC.1
MKHESSSPMTAMSCPRTLASAGASASPRSSGIERRYAELHTGAHTKKEMAVLMSTSLMGTSCISALVIPRCSSVSSRKRYQAALHTPPMTAPTRVSCSTALAWIATCRPRNMSKDCATRLASVRIAPPATNAPT